MAGDFKYVINKEIGVLSTTAKGWVKQINYITWNDKESKYDIREWAPDREKMGKGITLSLDELKALKNILNQMDEI